MKHNWSFVPPKGFVDRMPGRGLWLGPDSPPKTASWAYQAMLEDGLTTGRFNFPYVADRAPLGQYALVRTIQPPETIGPALRQAVLRVDPALGGRSRAHAVREESSRPGIRALPESRRDARPSSTASRANTGPSLRSARVPAAQPLWGHPTPSDHLVRQFSPLAPSGRLVRLNNDRHNGAHRT